MSWNLQTVTFGSLNVEQTHKKWLWAYTAVLFRCSWLQIQTRKFCTNIEKHLQIPDDPLGSSIRQYDPLGFLIPSKSSNDYGSRNKSGTTQIFPKIYFRLGWPGKVSCRNYHMSLSQDVTPNQILIYQLADLLFMYSLMHQNVHMDQSHISVSDKHGETQVSLSEFVCLLLQDQSGTQTTTVYTTTLYCPEWCSAGCYFEKRTDHQDWSRTILDWLHNCIDLASVWVGLMQLQGVCERHYQRTHSL